MIKIEHGATNLMEVFVSGNFKQADFDQITTLANEMIAKHGTLKILAHSSEFSGWEDFKTMQTHFAFVQEHHHKVDKLALIIGPWWQNFAINFAKMFVHPKIKTFELAQIEEAKKWLNE